MKTAEDIFECQQCGECCNGFGGTYITAKDMDKICRYIKADPNEFTEKYCEKSGSRFVLATGPDGFCVFFDKIRQCTIHPVKPYMCRAWPFIRTLLKHPENWKMMAGSCRGMKKGVSLENIQAIAEKEIKKLANKNK